MYIVHSMQIDEFVSWLEQIWWSLALHHLLTNGFSAMNGCRQLIKTIILK